MSKNLVIIPTYNEQDTIERLITVLFGLSTPLDILIVDDGSDQTSAIIQRLQAEHPNLFLIKRQTKSGRGTAVLEGMRFGLAHGYEYLIEMDADFSHQPEELPLLLAQAAPHRVVIGSRYLRGSKIVNWPVSRRIFSKLANFYAKLILGIRIHDYTNGYRVYSRDAVMQLQFERIKSRGYIVLSEIAYQLHRRGVEFVEVKTLFINRARGTSSFSLKEVKEAFASVLRIRREYR